LSFPSLSTNALADAPILPEPSVSKAPSANPDAKAFATLTLVFISGFSCFNCSFLPAPNIIVEAVNNCGALAYAPPIIIDAVAGADSAKLFVNWRKPLA